MESLICKPLTSGKADTQDSEVKLIDLLTIAMLRSGFQVDRIPVVNLYVALKHRPIAILAGPPGSGKATVVNYLAGLLAGTRGLPRQIMSGHAWYAASRAANTTLINMHTRLVTEKLMSTIEEALQPEKARQVFTVGLTHISPAELSSFFADVAFQSQHEEIMRIGDTHLTAPLPFPANLLLIGTMDTTSFDWWDQDLLSGATVIEWHAGVVAAPSVTVAREPPGMDYSFLNSSLRNVRKAYEKLFFVVMYHKQPLQTIMFVRDILQTHGLDFSPALLDEVVLYLANAWSQQGNGLFDFSTSQNLAIASDLALAQLVLPRSFRAIRSSENLQGELCSVLGERMPYSSSFLKRHCREYLPANSAKGV